MAIVSLVLGIVGLLFVLCCFGISIPLGIAALVLGYLGLKKSEELSGNGRGLAIAGMVLGGVTIVGSIASFIFFFSWNIS